MSNQLQPASGQIEGGIHHLPLRIYYEDTDAGGIVYHANYLRYFERARSEMLRTLGIDHVAAWTNGAPDERVGFAIRRVMLDYLAPALLDDALIVHTAVEKVAAAYVDVRQWITRGSDCIAKATLRVALVDATGKPRRLPQNWRDRMVSIKADSEMLAEK